MINKRSLVIDTQFFPQDRLPIPQAIRIAQSAQNQIYLTTENANDSKETSDHLSPHQHAVQVIQNIFTKNLVDRVISCWDTLKNYTQLFVASSLSGSNHRHRRTQQAQCDPHFMKIREELQLPFVQSKAITQSASNLHYFNLHNDRHDRNRGQQKQYMPYRDHDQASRDRARIMRQILEKLKYGRRQVVDFMGDIDKQRIDYQLQTKLSQIQKMVQDIHSSGASTLRYNQYPLSHLPPNPQPQQSKSQKTAMTNILREELELVRRQMQELRRNNLMLVELQKMKNRQQQQSGQFKNGIARQLDRINTHLERLQREANNKQQQKIGKIGNRPGQGLREYELQQQRQQQKKKYMQQVNELQQALKNQQLNYQQIMQKDQVTSTNSIEQQRQWQQQHSQWQQQHRNWQAEQVRQKARREAELAVKTDRERQIARRQAELSAKIRQQRQMLQKQAELSIRRIQQERQMIQREAEQAALKLKQSPPFNSLSSGYGGKQLNGSSNSIPTGQNSYYGYSPQASKEIYKRKQNLQKPEKDDVCCGCL